MIKRLGLVAIAAMALTACVNAASASASAPGFLATGTFPYPATISGSTAGETGANTINLFGATYPCTAPSFTATHKSPSSTLTMEGGAWAVASCNDTDLEKEPFDTHGCKFTFNPGSNAAEHFKGTFSIGPPGCGPITIEDFFIPSQGVCDIFIDPNAGFEALRRSTTTKTSKWWPKRKRSTRLHRRPARSKAKPSNGRRPGTS